MRRLRGLRPFAPLPPLALAVAELRPDVPAPVLRGLAVLSIAAAVYLVTELIALELTDPRRDQ